MNLQFSFFEKANTMELAWTVAQCVLWIMITTCATNLASARVISFFFFFFFGGGGVFIFILF